jgi:hypothetical protein
MSNPAGRDLSGMAIIDYDSFRLKGHWMDRRAPPVHRARIAGWGKLPFFEAPLGEGRNGCLGPMAQPREIILFFFDAELPGHERDAHVPRRNQGNLQKIARQSSRIEPSNTKFSFAED